MKAVHLEPTLLNNIIGTMETHPYLCLESIYTPHVLYSQLPMAHIAYFLLSHYDVCLCLQLQ